MSKMNRTKFNVCVNLQSCSVLFKVYTCAIWFVCVLSLYVGIASTLLFTAFVYSQITLFKVRSVKRVWRINAHFRPYVFRRRRGVARFWGEQEHPLALDLSSAGKEQAKQGEVFWGGGRGGRFIWGTTALSYLTRGEGPTTLKIGGRQWTPRLRGEKLEHHIQAALFPNQPTFPPTILLRCGRLFYVTMTLNLTHSSNFCSVCACVCV